MKTFEERYTAWIDGQLTGPLLAGFEQELARRAAAGEAEADRTDTVRLRHLLRDHFDAPELSNAEFFSHQLRERIAVERSSTARRPEGSAVRGGIFALFPWSVGRLAGLGAACLFVAGALYYGLEPRPGIDGGQQVASVTPRGTGAAVQPEAVVDSSPAAPAVPRDPEDANKYVKNSPTPTPLPLWDVSPDIEVHDTTAASATALRYQKPNVNVLWTNGLEYLPDLAGTPAPVPTAVPGGSVVP